MAPSGKRREGARAPWGPPQPPYLALGGPVAARGRPVRRWRAPGIHFSSRDKMFNTGTRDKRRGRRSSDCRQQPRRGVERAC